MEMYKIINATPLRKYIVFLQFDDGLSGELDFSFAAHKGVFEAWENGNHFFEAKIIHDGRALEWPVELDMCADSLYLRLIEQKENTSSTENIYASN
jgi:Protein of unknown function (DUF2442)